MHVSVMRELYLHARAMNETQVGTASVWIVE